VDRNAVTDHGADYFDLLEDTLDKLGAIASANEQLLHSRTNQPALNV
jgi:hypothetical protein